MCVAVGALSVSGYLLYRLNNAIWTAQTFRRERDEAMVEKEEHGDKIRRDTLREMDGVVKQKIVALKAAFEIDNAHLLSQALVTQNARDLQTTIKNIIEQRYGRMSQELLGSLSDEAEGLARDLQIELSEKIWDAFQQYKECAKETPIVWAEGTKVAYTKGIRTVVVIEQKPQVRSVTFDSELVQTKAIADKAQGTSNNGYRFALAFPYVYFVVVFDRGKYSYHELYFRNKPLTSMREHIYLAPLPNVWRDKDKKIKNMCMGDGFKKAVDGELTIARQCEIVVGDFWQRTFSKDLGNGEPEKVDKRIKNYGVWQDNSAEDPLFVLTVQWPKGKTMKGVLETALDGREQKDALDPVDNEIKVLLTTGCGNLSNKVKEAIRTAKGHTLSSVQLDQEARTKLEELITSHTRKVFEQCAKRQ